MDNKDFFDNLGRAYSYNYEEDLGRIENIANKQSGEELIWTVIEIDDGKLHVYREFVYDEGLSNIQIYMHDLALLHFLQSVGKKYRTPEIEYPPSYGCPYDSVEVGFFNLDLNIDAVINILKGFEASYQVKEEKDLDTDYLSNYFSAQYESFLETKCNIFNKLLKECDNTTFEYEQIRVKSKLKNTSNIDENEAIFINEFGSCIIGHGLTSLMKVKKIIGDCQNAVDRYYIGLKFFFCESEQVTLSADVRLVKDVIQVFERVDFENGNNIEYKTDKNVYVLLQAGYLWAIVFIVKKEFEILASQERELIRQLQNNFQHFIPNGLLKDDYPFAQISDADFEKMCRDILVELGYKNVVQRGCTNAADGGVDLTADEEYQNLLGHTEKRRWIFQCKHTKGQIDRKDISEVPCLLKEFSADRYGIFYSGVFTPKTLDRLTSLDCFYWGKSELEIFLKSHKTISLKYFGI